MMNAREADKLIDDLRHTCLAEHPLVARLIAEWDRGDMEAYKLTCAELDEIGRKYEANFRPVKPDFVFGQSSTGSADQGGDAQGSN